MTQPPRSSGYGEIQQGGYKMSVRCELSANYVCSSFVTMTRFNGGDNIVVSVYGQCERLEAITIELVWYAVESGTSLIIGCDANITQSGYSSKINERLLILCVS